MKEQQMILVNEQDEQIGTLEKTATHEQGLLHRAFSVFLFNKNGEMLLQRRAISKYHSPGLWSNSCCSHPLENELLISAANRRLKEELGITAELKPSFSFIYKANMENGLIEHEYDHVFIGNYDGEIICNEEEVAETKYISLDKLTQDMELNSNQYTAWFKIVLPQLCNWLNKEVNN